MNETDEGRKGPRTAAAKTVGKVLAAAIGVTIVAGGISAVTLGSSSTGTSTSSSSNTTTTSSTGS